MDPIHPIRPTSAQPPAVQPVRRVLPVARDPTADERPRREGRRSPAPPPPPAAPADEHIDVQA
jgi:hypothetical protein